MSSDTCNYILMDGVRSPVEWRHKKQPNKSLEFNFKGGCSCMGVHVSICLKDELVLATDSGFRL